MLSRSLSPTLSLSGSAGFERQASRRSFESYNQSEVGLRLQKALPAPMGGSFWYAALNGRTSLRAYDSVDATIDSNRERQDRGYSLGLAFTVPFQSGASWIIEARRQWRRSNLPNFAFTDTTVTTGVRYSF